MWNGGSTREVDLFVDYNEQCVQCTFKAKKQKSSVKLIASHYCNLAHRGWQWPCLEIYICSCNCARSSICMKHIFVVEIFKWVTGFKNSYPHLMSDIKLFWRIQQFNCWQWWWLEGCVLYAKGRFTVQLCASLPFEFVLVCRCLVFFLGRFILLLAVFLRSDLHFNVTGISYPFFLVA